MTNFTVMCMNSIMPVSYLSPQLDDQDSYLIKENIQ